jgi:hypothetical protein
MIGLKKVLKGVKMRVKVEAVYFDKHAAKNNKHMILNLKVNDKPVMTHAWVDIHDELIKGIKNMDSLKFTAIIDGESVKDIDDLVVKKRK